MSSLTQHLKELSAQLVPTPPVKAVPTLAPGRVSSGRHASLPQQYATPHHLVSPPQPEEPKGMSLITKILIGASIVALIGIGIVLFKNKDKIASMFKKEEVPVPVIKKSVAKKPSDTSVTEEKKSLELMKKKYEEHLQILKNKEMDLIRQQQQMQVTKTLKPRRPNKTATLEIIEEETPEAETEVDPVKSEKQSEKGDDSVQEKPDISNTDENDQFFTKFS